MAPPRKLFQAVGATPQSACDAIGATSSDGLNSGTYVPSITIFSGTVLSINGPISPFIYSRVGNVVTVTGGCNVTSTGAGSVTLQISVPIPTTVATGSGVLTPTAATANLGRSVIMGAVSFPPVSMIANITTVGAVAGVVVQFTFQYVVG